MTQFLDVVKVEVLCYLFLDTFPFTYFIYLQGIVED